MLNDIGRMIQLNCRASSNRKVEIIDFTSIVIAKQGGMAILLNIKIIEYKGREEESREKRGCLEGSRDTTHCVQNTVTL